MSFKFFSNKKCKFFPCHNKEFFDKPDKPVELNCLFCFCPLYAMGDKCGGTFKYSEKGVKDCMNCHFPHKPEHYDLVIEKLIEWGPGGKC